MRKSHLLAMTLALFSLALTAQASADNYTIDGSHASAYFMVDHLGISPFQGMFTKISGSFEDGKSINIVIDTASIYTADRKRDDHLRGPDFFNTKQHPKMTFKSTKVVSKGKDVYSVTGNLTIRGKTKSITIEVKKTGAGKDPWGNFRMGYFTEFTINRLDYGISFMPDGLGKNVTLRISLEGIKK